MSPVGVIVDGFSSGANLPWQFGSIGVSCIHVHSQPHIPAVYKHTFKPSSYIKCIPYMRLEQLVKILSQWQPLFVIAGSEPGVEYADLLGQKLQLANMNDVNLSAARRNKFLMSERLRAVGLKHISSYQAGNARDIVQWAEQKARWPYVVKPVNSAGGDQVAICNDRDTLFGAVNDILQQKVNMLGYANEQVLVQPYIKGRELVVNTVSYKSNHCVCEVWEYSRVKLASGQNIYDRAKLVTSDQVDAEVIDYVKQVNDALGIHHGPAHAEVIISEDGPVLVELGARLMGANLPAEVLSSCVPACQAKMTVYAFAQPESFKRLMTGSYTINKHFSAIFMIASQRGILPIMDKTEELKRLSSFAGLNMAIESESDAQPTIDYATCPGMIYLAHEDWQVVENDYNIIRNIESGAEGIWGCMAGDRLTHKTAVI